MKEKYTRERYANEKYTNEKSMRVKESIRMKKSI